MTISPERMDWLNSPWTREQEKAIAQFIDLTTRLRTAILTGSQEGLHPGDLDWADTPRDVMWVTFTLPRPVWEYWNESFAEHPEESIRDHAIHAFERDGPDSRNQRKARR